MNTKLNFLTKSPYKEIICSIAQQHDSFYLYQEEGILAQMQRLQAAFPSVQFLYSIKCNPNAYILRTVFAHGFGADAASAAEVMSALQNGCKTEDIYYSAPGKTAADIEKALGKAALIADSLGEIERIAAIAQEAQRPVKIGIRINPCFSFDIGTCSTSLPEKNSRSLSNFSFLEATPENSKDSAVFGNDTENRVSASRIFSSKFGIDEDQAFAFLKTWHHPYVTVTGLHVHLRSQELSTEKLMSYHAHVLALANRLQTECSCSLDYINMGSGIGIPYAHGDVPVDIEALGAAAEHAIAAFREKYPHTRFLIETGRFIVGQNGIYVTKVLDKKRSGGITYLIVKNTLNGFLRPSLEKMITRYAAGHPAFATEPLFTKEHAFSLEGLQTTGSEIATETERVTVVGNLCTAADVIAENIFLPKLDCGDLLLLSNAGAYARVLSPLQFSSQDPPAEFFLAESGDIF